jgi:hypothetical protein
MTFSQNISSSGCAKMVQNLINEAKQIVVVVVVVDVAKRTSKTWI